MPPKNSVEEKHVPKHHKEELSCCSSKEDAPSLDELKDWHRRSGLPLKRFFNTSGLKYKELGLKDKLPGLDEEEQLALLASDGMLVKRPILVGDDFVLAGFRENEWAVALGADRH